MPSKILELRRKVSGSFNNEDSLSYVKTNWSGIDGKPLVYPPAGHTHPWAQITGKPSIMTVQEGTDGEDTAAKILNAYNLKGIIQGLMPTIPGVMPVQEGINGNLTTARTINAANLRGIIEDYIENAPYKSLPLGTSRTSSFTFAIGDANRFIRCSGGAIIATVPPNSSVAFPIGTEIYLYRESTGAVTIAAGSGVTLQSVDNKKSISKQYQTITIKKLAVNTWTIVGAL